MGPGGGGGGGGGAYITSIRHHGVYHHGQTVSIISPAVCGQIGGEGSDS